MDSLNMLSTTQRFALVLFSNAQALVGFTPPLKQHGQLQLCALMEEPSLGLHC
jgi:hypothetical protein